MQNCLPLLMLCACFFGAGLQPLHAQDNSGYLEDFYQTEDDLPQVPDAPTPPKEKSKDDQAMLGGQFTPPSSNAQEQNGTTPDQGVETRRVFPGTAADDMGLQPGDIVLSINDRETNSISNLREIVNQSSVGDDASVLVSRNGEIITLNSTFKNWLNGIPKEKIDSKAEQRYREMQKTRIERRMAGNDEKESSKPDLEDRLAQHAAQMAATKNAALLDLDTLDKSALEARLSQILGILPDYTLPAISLSGLPINFTFRIDVDSKTISSDEISETDTNIAEPLTAFASMAPEINLSYQFSTNADEL